MSNLDYFFQNVPSETVIGTYLYPHVLLGKPNFDDPYSATSIISKLEVDDLEIFITLNGGLFVKPPMDLVQIAEKIEFEERVSKAFNLIICEFAFNGIVSVPATPVHIAVGKLINNHALIISASGGSEMYLEKTMEQSMHLIRGTWRTHRMTSPDIIQKVIRLDCSTKLMEVSQNLPALIAGAYSYFSQRQLSESLLDSWIVIEQILDWYWSNYVSKFSDKKRKESLKDSRTYTSAVRIEILCSASVFPQQVYEKINNARKHRNNLAHRAKINISMAKETVDALKLMIEFFCGCSINPFLVNEGVNW